MDVETLFDLCVSTDFVVALMPVALLSICAGFGFGVIPWALGSVFRMVGIFTGVDK